MKAKSHLKGQELTKTRDVQREQLRAHFDLQRTYDELDQMFQNTEREAIDTEIESLKSQLDELDEEETAYRDELANLRVNIEGLSSDEQASEGRAARELWHAAGQHSAALYWLGCKLNPTLGQAHVVCQRVIGQDLLACAAVRRARALSTTYVRRLPPL